ncbi:hypothetical protein SSP24_69400 [Streptomyces spinoverrucosus]|uniref:HTH luxR-type domain-containing protein n=1 Tax=Streptomyces spinoverrucosus TaxID=284043 RepID=A0A4Y3VT93_9ACTN|nr:hypothetical protein SSP24_69400 [Streptomyces spinoverrucosus]GHB44676.1 hypothetical protein GCM10010397_12970 [Streptomyces spinoverrucosus]
MPHLLRRVDRAHSIATHLVVTERAIAKHTSNIFAKLGLEVSDDDNRRVLAVLAYLDHGR